jgi:hypothetical protein
MHVNTVSPLMDCYQHQARVNVLQLHRNAPVQFTTFFAHKIASSVTTDVPAASHFLMAHRQMYHHPGASDKPTTTSLFDVFRACNRGQPRLLASLPTLEEARARVEVLGATKPGEYFVFSQLSLLEESIKVERRRPHEVKKVMKKLRR